MGLIEVPQLSDADLAHWRQQARGDLVLAQTRPHRARIAPAENAIADFTLAGRCYCGVSWGKDSVVVADMVCRLGLFEVPLVWVRVRPVDNPHCQLVRDAFLARYPRHPYEEIVVEWDPTSVRTGALTSGGGFELAAERHGERYISGIRADESADRRKRGARWGTTSPRTCAPLNRWSSRDVFAYLAAHDLPIHPAYAMTMGGAYDRLRVRVAALGGSRGTGVGREEWERHYYHAELAAAGLLDRARVRGG